MQTDAVVEMTRQAIITAMTLASPLLLVGLVVGLVVGLIQAVTQVQDPTISLVPRMLAMLVALAFCLPWLLEQMMAYTTSVLTTLPMFP